MSRRRWRNLGRGAVVLASAGGVMWRLRVAGRKARSNEGPGPGSDDDYKAMLTSFLSPRP